MGKLAWHRALSLADECTEWTGDEPDVLLSRAPNDTGVIQFADGRLMFGNWDGERGTDGALLTLENGDVYNECGGLVSKGRR